MSCHPVQKCSSRRRALDDDDINDEIVAEADTYFQARMACHSIYNHLPAQWDAGIRNIWKELKHYLFQVSLRPSIERSVQQFISSSYVGLSLAEKIESCPK